MDHLPHRNPLGAPQFGKRETPPLPQRESERHPSSDLAGNLLLRGCYASIPPCVRGQGTLPLSVLRFLRAAGDERIPANRRMVCRAAREPYAKTECQRLRGQVPIQNACQRFINLPLEQACRHRSTRFSAWGTSPRTEESKTSAPAFTRRHLLPP